MEEKLTQASTDVNFIASQAVARSQMQNPRDEAMNGEQMTNGDAMEMVEQQSNSLRGFVAAESGPQGGTQPPVEEYSVANPDALEVDI